MWKPGPQPRVWASNSPISLGVVGSASHALSKKTILRRSPNCFRISGGYHARVSRSVRVSIAGNQFSVRTDAKPKYVRDLAAYVEEKMAEAKGNRSGMSTQTLVLLAAMSIADELKQSQREQRDFKREVRERSTQILKTLEREAQS